MIKWIKKLFTRKPKTFNPLIDQNFASQSNLTTLRMFSKYNRKVVVDTIFHIKYDDIKDDNYVNYYYLVDTFAKIGNRGILAILWIDGLTITIEEFRDRFTRLFMNSAYIIYKEHPEYEELKMLKVSDNVGTYGKITNMTYDEFQKLNKSRREERMKHVQGN